MAIDCLLLKTRYTHVQWILNIPISVFQCIIIQPCPLLGLYDINGLNLQIFISVEVTIDGPLWTPNFEGTVSSASNWKDWPCKLCTFFAAEKCTLAEGLECFVSLTYSKSLSRVTWNACMRIVSLNYTLRAGPIKTVLGNLRYLAHWTADSLLVVSYVCIHA